MHLSAHRSTYYSPISPVKHPQGPPPNPDSHPVHLITKAGQTEQLCGPLSLRPSRTPPRGVGWGSLPYEESNPFHHLGPSRCNAREALLCSLDRTGDEPHTEAHHLSDRGSHFSDGYPPPRSPAWSQSLLAAGHRKPRSSCYSGDPGYPPRKMPSRVPTVRYQDSILQGVRRR